MTIVEREFDIDGLTIAGRHWQADDAETPVLALHGWLDNAASFDALGEAGLPLLALDMPGNGRSGDKPAHATYNIWDDLLVILAVADQMGWARFNLLGHSRGAMMSMLLTASCPERIDRLICLDGLIPGPMNIDDTAKQLGDFLRDYRQASARRAKIHPSLDALIATRQRVTGMSEAAARRLAERGAREVEGGWVWHADPRVKAASAFKMTDEHNKALLRALERPLLLLVAEEGYAKFPELEQLLGLPRRATVETFPGGHHFHMEASAPALAGRIRQFLTPEGEIQ